MQLGLSREKKTTTEEEKKILIIYKRADRDGQSAENLLGKALMGKEFRNDALIPLQSLGPAGALTRKGKKKRACSKKDQRKRSRGRYAVICV